jgi:hypothetical protein
MKIGEDLFGGEVHAPLKTKGRPKVNPCIAVWGTGPEGTKCGACKHHYFRRLASAYPKCAKRGDTGSASTDHSSRYPACGQFEPKS